MMNPYEAIVEAIVNKHVDVLGKMIALERASHVEGLELDDNGNVKKISGNGTVVLESLIHQFQDLLGPAGVSFCKNAAAPIIKQNPGLLLPQSLHE